MTMGVIFDGDDTLWLTERLYDEARAAARGVVERSDLDGARWEQLERQIDVKNVAVLGHAIERFPRSCAEAYVALCIEAGVPIDPKVTNLVRAAGAMVFDTPAPLRPAAREVLAELSDRGVKLALLTKGDHDVQRKRIADSGLRPFFDVVEIVAEKNAAVVAQVVRSLGLEPHAVLSVGNSVRSDVLPSIEAGVRAVWIPAHVWEYERAHDHLVPGDVDVIAQLPELSELVNAR